VTSEQQISAADTTRIHPGPLTRSGIANATEVPARNNNDA
jgi:hypothetical protein